MWLKCRTKAGVATAGAPVHRGQAASGLAVCMTDSGSSGTQTRLCVIGVTLSGTVARRGALPHPSSLLMVASWDSFWAAAPESMLSFAMMAASLKLWALPAARSAVEAFMATML